MVGAQSAKNNTYMAILISIITKHEQGDHVLQGLELLCNKELFF